MMIAGASAAASALPPKACSRPSHSRIEELPTNSTPPGRGACRRSAAAKASRLDCQRGSIGRSTCALALAGTGGAREATLDWARAAAAQSPRLPRQSNRPIIFRIVEVS